MQDCEATHSLYFPAAQTTHRLAALCATAEAASSAKYVPAAQLVHDVEASDALYLPAPQTMHRLAELKLKFSKYVPAAQLVHAGDADALYVPAGQMVQSAGSSWAVARAESDRYVPAGQGVHVADVPDDAA